MSDYTRVATIIVENENSAKDIAQTLVTGGYTIAYSIDATKIYILEENDNET